MLKGLNILNSYRQQTICLFSALYLPHVGGVENFTDSLAHELIRQGYRVIIVTSNHALLPNKSQPQDNLIIYRLPCTPLLDSRLPWPKKNSEFHHLEMELEHEPIDFICINTRFYPHSLIGAQLARKKGLTPVIIEHGSDYLTLGNPLIDWVIRRYEHFITCRLKAFHPEFYAVSKRASEWLRTFRIKSQGEVNNAIDAEAFRAQSSGRDFRKELQLSSSDFLVSFAGRLTPEKGIEQLVAAAQLLQDRTNIHFLIAGKGVLERRLKKIASPSVHFLGMLSREDLSALLQTSNAFCLPSRSEGFATVLLEAASCGAVPVVTNFGGSDELVPTEEFGIVLPDNNPQTIANALIELSANSDSLRDISTRIQQRAETNYNWQEAASALVEAFRITNPTNFID